MKQSKSLKIVTGIIAAIAVVALVYLIFNLTKADTVYYGNFVTMDDSNPSAEAVAVKGGRITYVGDKQGAEAQKGSFTKVEDYGENYVYPGFLDGHAHLGIFSTIEANGATLELTASLTENAQIMKQYIEDNPGQEVYKGYGWWKFAEDATDPTHEFLDQHCSNEVPVVIVDGGGHSAILNQKAIDYFDLKNKVSIYGTDGVQVDASGNPTGYLSETPRFDVAEAIKVSKDDLKKFFLTKQEMYVKQGYTTIMDAGIIETDALPMVSAFKELADEGKLKLKLRSYIQISETQENKLEEVEKAIKYSKEINYDKFKVVGIKIFLDGVIEGMSSWTSQPYVSNEKGANYYGYKRWDENSKDELVQIINKANENGLMMHFHSYGEAATSYALDCFEAASAGKTDANYRNGLGHVANISEKDYQRIIDNNVCLFVAPHWASYKTGTKENEIKIYGETQAKQLYKIKTFIDKGITTSFHTDGMCAGGVPEMIYSAVSRMHPIAELYEHTPRGIEERISALQSLKCMTTTTAYTMKEENNLGCIKVGMSADFTIYDIDLTDDSKVVDDSILDAKLIASISNDKHIYPYFEN